MKTKNLLLPIGISLLTLTTQAKKNDIKPNIILFVVDDLGWMDTGFNGSQYYETPNVDKMAHQGVIFTNAYTNAANCAPTRASIWSGVYGPRHGVYTVDPVNRGAAKDRKYIPDPNNHDLAASFYTLAETMHDHGYFTCHVGKWHLGDDKDGTGPCSQGFDVNIGGNHAGHPRRYFSPYKNPDIPDGQEGEYLTDRLTDEAIKLIDKSGDKPLFMNFAHYAVHTPIQGKEEYTDYFSTHKAWGKQDNAEYAGMVKSMDESFGRIVNELKKTGKLHNTLIVFMSDNGGAGTVTSCAPLKGAKGMLYEGGIRVPMFAYWYGHTDGGTTFEEPVMGMDLYPTFMEAARIKKTPAQLDGTSWLEALESGKRDFFRDRPLYWHFPGYLEGNPSRSKNAEDLVYGKWRAVPSAAIREGDWKLIENFETHNFELYNLHQDLSESHNLEALYPEKVEELHEKMVEWRKEVKAHIPTKLNSQYSGTL